MSDELQSLATLSIDERELFSYFLEESGLRSALEQPIPPREKDAANAAPLSFEQQRLWFLNQLQPDSSVYNIASATRLAGSLRVESLERALSEILRRHEVLRTTFTMAGEQPVQIVAAPQPLRLPVDDLRHLHETEREEELQRLIDFDSKQPFDMEHGPLFRIRLVRLAADEHVIVMVLHHIISDAWSVGVLFKEVSELYNAFCDAKPYFLPELTIQYADYAAWQRNWLRGETLEKQLEYWRNQLTGAPAVLDLPHDRQRPAVQNMRGATLYMTIPAEVAQALKKLSLEEGTSVFIVLLAAFKTLLFRYSGQTDVVVGTPVAGRNRVEVEDLIGFFVNTLVLRTDASGNPTFRELMRRVKEVALDAYEHQELPFEKLVEELNVERNLSHHPLFQVMFSLQNAPQESLHLSGLRLSRLGVSNETSKFDLTLEMAESAGEFVGAWYYNTDLFSDALVRQMVGQFEVLLRDIAARPDKTLSSLSLLTDSERRRLLVEWNDTAVESKPEESLQTLIEKQVERSPDRIALLFEDEKITYAELNRRANKLAHHLQRLGVGPEKLVGVCMERSVELVVSLLAVLKAGGAYVPLDPDYPSERLSFMLEDARIEVLLAQPELIDDELDFAGRIVCPVRDWEEISRESGANPRSEIHPDSLAYMIYTSGSTGQPKGAMNTQRGIANRLRWMQDAYQLNAGDVVLQKTPFSFDVSVWEFFWPLLAGAQLVLATPGGHRDAAYLLETINLYQVTTLHFVPSMLRIFLDEMSPESCPSVRRVICSGEALSAELQEQFFEKSNAALHNLYGPTEASIDVTHWTCERGRQNVPIGRPVANTQIFILDTHHEPVPVGVCGELYIGGTGVARGYLNRAGLTAEKFIPNPFSPRGGERLYRTGDVARYLPDGNIEYVGRADHQVKLRGFRIELGEIESALREHPSVADGVVALRQPTTGDAHLVAYVAGLPDEPLPTTGNLRGFLKDKLPDYMLPAIFVALEKLPLTTSGKVDRAALPEPEMSRPELNQAYAAPRTEIEEALAAIWSKVLMVDEVGIHDNFFDLGGDSIRSVRVLALAKESGLNFSLQQLFRFQTVHELGKEIVANATRVAPEEKSGAFTLISEEDRRRLPVHVEDAYPLAMLQAGMLYHMAYKPTQMVYHNVYSYHLKAAFKPEALQQTLARIVHRHPILRTAFDLHTYSEPLQLVHRTAVFDAPITDIHHLSFDEQEDALRAFVESEKWRRFDYSQPPLLRFHIHLRGDETFNFTLTECHPIFDGWSLHSLLAEILTTYFALLNDESLPEEQPLASSYREFVRLERLALESEECKRFWDEKLRECSVMELPRWPMPEHGRENLPRIHKQIFPISAESSEKLKELARSLGVSLKTVFLAAHVKVMSIISAQTDVLTGLISVGRPEELDGEKVLGLFFNTTPLRLKLPDGTWAELIRETFKAELELLPFRRYPMAALQMQWGKKPLFESLFNYLDFHVLHDPLNSGHIDMLGTTSAWEETNLTLSTSFMRMQLSPEIMLNVRYDTSQFCEEQIARVGGYYYRVLGAMLDETASNHNARSFLSDEETRQLLVEWNDSEKDYGQTFIHQMFEAQAAANPDAVAVVCEDARLSYRELNERANQLAHLLRKSGVGAEVVVGLCFERSVEMIVCLLAVVKAGGGYVCLDPTYPKERLALILEESGAHILLTEQKLAETLPQTQARVVCVDTDAEAISREPTTNPTRRVEPENIVYMFFTSGSTGKPKGVAVEHRQLANYVNGIVGRLSLTGRANFATVSTFMTDLGNTVIFPSLCAGGCLHVVSQERVSNPRLLADYSNEHAIDYLKIVPTHLAALLASYPSRDILPRRKLILGGEACGWELVKTVRELAPECDILNHYGPTETTVGVTTFPVGEIKDGTYSATVPLGRPLANAETFILDSKLNPVPVAVPGELYIGGSGLARGYFSRPDLTAERFVPHPFGNASGARLYKTGDLARYLPDGNIEFLGRTDQQTKIRGYRIELGEIEAVLEQHLAVREAVVQVREDTSGIKRLVAYVVASGAAGAPDIAALHAHLKDRLPEYMLPSAIMVLDALPLSPAGKLDRSLLPRPASFLPDSNEASYVAPTGATERAIAAVWQEVLQVERLSVNANLFDMGGHSLILLQIHSKLRGKLRRDISIVEMFEYPTISRLARHLSSEQADSLPLSEFQEQATARRESLRRRKRLAQSENV